MIDSLEKLAQSSTFAVRDGRISPIADDQDGSAGTALLAPGSVVDTKYKIVGLIGQGGMGAIYKARHMLLLKDVALKTFRSHGLSPDSWQRFQREAQSIARLNHKNIVDVFDFGITEQGLPYYTMELLTGKSLADELQKSGRLAPTQALKIFIQVADALAHAHRQSIVHRDIKPANIILVGETNSHNIQNMQRQAKLVDFGIAKLAENSPQSNDQSLTRAGTIFGSPLYMSPEQSLGLPTDHRTDMYSFACTLYETLTGKPPFIGDTAFITMLHHQRQGPPTLTEGAAQLDVPQRLEGLMARLFAKKPEDRYKDFDQILEELEWCLKAIPPERQTVARMGNVIADTDSVAEADTAIEAAQQKWPISPRAAAILAAGAACLSLGVLFSIFLWPSNPPVIPAATTITGGANSDTTPGTTSVPAVSATIRNGKHYLVRSDDNEKVFFFPTRIGSFSVAGQPLRQCLGEFPVPAKAPILFIAAPGPAAIFDGFGPNDLSGIQVLPTLEEEWTGEHLEAITKLTGLKSLELTLTQRPTIQAVATLDRLQNLRMLNIARANIRGSDLIGLKILPDLEQLTVSNLMKLSGLWPQLAGDRARLQVLIANNCNFSLADLSYVGKIKNLSTFSATYSHITASSLAALVPATNLQRLNLRNNYLNDSAIEYLARYRNLKEVTLTPKNFSAAGLVRLKDRLPAGCKIILWEKSKEPTVLPDVTEIN